MASKKSICSRIWDWIKKYPLQLGSSVVIVVASWVYFASDRMNDPTLKKLNYELSLNLLTEIIILIATVFVVKAFLDARKEDERKPVYNALYGSIRSIYEEIHELIYHSLAETIHRKYNDGFICPWIDSRYIHFVQENHGSEKSLDILSSLFGELNGDFKESKDGIILPINAKYNISSSIDSIYNQLENFLQRHGAFLGSDETGDAGSRLLRDVEFLRHVSSVLKKHIDLVKNKKSGVVIQIQKKERGGGYDFRIRGTGDNESGVSEFDLSQHHLPVDDENRRVSEFGKLTEHYRETLCRLGSLGKMHEGSIVYDRISSMAQVMYKYSGGHFEWAHTDFRRHYLRSCRDYYQFIEKSSEREKGEAVVAHALSNLGRMYETGDGVGKKDLDKAIKYYNEAARQIGVKDDENDGDIHFQIGRMYMQKGMMQNETKTMEQFQKAADRGSVDARFSLGTLYKNKGQDDKAEECFKRSAYQYMIDVISNSDFLQGMILANGKDLAVSHVIHTSIAQFRLAEMFELGLDVKRWHQDISIIRINDEPKKIETPLTKLFVDQSEKDLAKELYRTAAYNGHPCAEYKLALIYEGEGDDKEAEKWYHKATEKGHPGAQYKIGEMIYRRGEDKELQEIWEDRERAQKWFKKAAENGHAEAQFRYGNMIKEGYYVRDVFSPRVSRFPPTPWWAEEWFQKAAYQDHTEAQYELGIIHRDALRLIDVQRATLGRTDVHRDSNEAERSKKAAEWFRKAADQGHAEAQYELGIMYRNGHGVEKNSTEEKRYLLAAAKQYQPEAWREIMVRNSFDYVEPNEWKELCVDAYANKDPSAALIHEPAIYALRDLSEKDYIDVKAFMAREYFFNDNTCDGILDDTKASEWLYEAVKWRHQTAAPQRELEFIFKDELQDALPSIRKQAETDKASCQFVLGALYLEDVGVEPDDGNKTKAAKWFRKAAEQNHADAQFQLGIMYRDDIGVEPDCGNKTKAGEWFRKAAEQSHKEALRELASQGYEDAQFRLGLYLRLNEANVDESLKWLHRAGEVGHVPSQNYLGFFYLSNPQEETKSFEWFKRAAEQNDSEAQYLIGRLYGSGQGGVAKDVDKSNKYFHLAAEQGHIHAHFQLGLNLASSSDLHFLHSMIFLFDRKSKDMWRKQWEDNYSTYADEIKKAIEYLTFSAERGHSRAKFFLGCYYHLMGDHIRAADLFYNAAIQGNDAAFEYLNKFSEDSVDPHFQYYLAAIYLSGWDWRGRDKLGGDIDDLNDNMDLRNEEDAAGWGQNAVREPDPAEATKWFSRAAEQNHPAAQFHLGCLYYDGRAGSPSNGNDPRTEGVKWLLQAAASRNCPEAVDWFRAIAEEGDDSHVQYLLASMYQHGWGIEPDPAEAVKWFFQAAEQGHPDAVRQVGLSGSPLSRRSGEKARGGGDSALERDADDGR